MKNGKYIVQFKSEQIKEGMFVGIGPLKKNED